VEQGAGLKPVPGTGLRGASDSVARFTIGTEDEESEGSGPGSRVEVPMGEDDIYVGETMMSRSQGQGKEETHDGEVLIKFEDTLNRTIVLKYLLLI